MAAACAEMEPPAAPPPSPPPAAAAAAAAAAAGSAELVCAQGRNLKAVLCQRCGSRVLLPGAATFARRELLLPAMRKKAAAAAGGGGDLLREHWLVRDMFSFENVGFTRDVGNVKFLVCADCEAGPIGWHCLDDKDSFYVALERVAHE
ncbi:guanine nucleotide exchange factor MSS4 [Aquila chrysaetos chrysaetos]|uniref:Guanine nucleotide exchange factor MSS4 n=2 Tax=Accipitrinae TaxID=8955 RepID=A0A663EV20_AQUCH|nr:guanine nucleotide exchange factor MSS4 [Aquila chrysaetos chrysaetos]